MDPYIRRTYEPFGFMGRIFFVPMVVTADTRAVSYSATWQDNGEHWGPTLVARIPFTQRALGIGLWFKAPTEIVAVHEEDAEFDAYQAVNGAVNRDAWEAARKKIAAQGLDPDDEMEIMQAMGIFE